jgi:magnesium transporter
MAILTIPKFKLRKRKHTAPGAAPGTLLPSIDLPKPKIERIIYDENTFERHPVGETLQEEIFRPIDGKTVWVDIQGLGDTPLIQEIGNILDLHPLIIEDIVHVHQRPKHEEYNTYIYTVLRALQVHEESAIDNEQISFVLKEGLLITFQERPGDVFEPVRKRIAEGKGVIRSGGADYLFYALVDAVVDNYFPVLETYEETMDHLEDEVRLNPTPELSRNLHEIRRQLRRLRRCVWPLREMLNALIRGEIALVNDTVRVFFRDCYDHVFQVADLLESNKERASDLGDLYMFFVSEKTNQVMNWLTIVATIFIPLTFLCGVYGMNFDPEASPYNMPELEWQYGYPVFWGVLIAIFLGMLWFFKRKGWLPAKK